MTDIYCLNCYYQGRPSGMRYAANRDTYYHSSCNLVIPMLSVVKDEGRGTYWATAKDLGNSGAGSSTGVAQHHGTSGTSSGANTGTGGNPSLTYTQLTNLSQQMWSTGALSSMSVFAKEPESSPLPVEKRDEPIKAWRSAKDVKVSANGITLFFSLHANTWYSLTDRAFCAANRTHHWTDIPVENCTCGFWCYKPEAVIAYRDFDSHSLDYNEWEYNVLLEVELYGRVIEAEYGYRAQHQRIMAVYTDLVKELPGVPVQPRKYGYDKLMKEVRAAEKRQRDKEWLHNYLMEAYQGAFGLVTPEIAKWMESS